MSFFLKSLAAGVFTIASFSVGATTAPVLDTTPQMAYEDISRSLTELQPITFQSGVEKYKILVFVDNQCVYCSYVVKNIKKYTDAGLTMSFLTVVPSSIKDSVIEDMGRVWCASDRQKSFQNAMAGFLPDNDSSEKCKNLVIKHSELADRLGVTVTPAMVVLEPSVHTFLGSVSPDKILSELQ
ncbi:thioredoxin fold domain-containing protein [Klebsiella quasipneumoniae]|uniref:thioredoxin fold domain-containing protein n=2 Tax=Klebsiella pneumoniae complex TaxID=3390273 RepID=UPI0015DCE1D1|nr:thioredoxin fold domain-containing protein [Klebsiella quasipneumoniae]BBR18217.1 hypothetical protein WP3S18E03_P21250 [Klebsiella quasipneumoniae]